MSFINSFKSVYSDIKNLCEQPWGSALEDFKDLSGTQKETIRVCTTLVAIGIITVPLAIIVFRSLVGRCVYNNDQLQQAKTEYRELNQRINKMKENEFKLLEFVFIQAVNRAKTSHKIVDKKAALQKFVKLDTFIKKNQISFNKLEYDSHKEVMDKFYSEIVFRKFKLIKNKFLTAWQTATEKSFNTFVINNQSKQEVINIFLELESFIKRHDSFKFKIDLDSFKELAITLYREINNLSPNQPVTLEDLSRLPNSEAHS